MSDLFLSYRRQDCPTATGRLADRLHAEFGAERVFLDVGDIVPGADFVQMLERALASATVVLALMGPGWLRAAAGDGSRRLDDPDDFVRREIEPALRQGKPVIPELLEGARMPGPQELPPRCGISRPAKRWRCPPIAGTPTPRRSSTCWPHATASIPVQPPPGTRGRGGAGRRGG